MRRHRAIECAGLILGLAAAPAIALAQIPDTAMAPNGTLGAETVRRFDLSGPRAGVTFSPDGTAHSQFGWHFEHQVASGDHGPSFLVETLLLAGGVEQQLFVPNWTMVFGIRLPNSFEFGIGPSATLGGSEFLKSALVIAAGRSFRAGAISVPVNIAVATNSEGSRVTLVSGWAIRSR